MDLQLIYAKTPIGDEAVRQSTRVVQRNLRMVLVQVDGKLSVGELSSKIGNARLVQDALRELEEGGFIAPTLEAASVWEESKRKAQKVEQVSALSQFSTFGPRSTAGDSLAADSMGSNFSSFGKPVLPASKRHGAQQSTTPGKAVVETAAPETLSTKSPSSSLRRLMFAAVGVFLASALLILFYPYQGLKPGIEAASTRLLQAPVQIGEVGLSFWPRPLLTLSKLRAGETDEFTIEQVRIASPLSLMSGKVRELPDIEILGASIPADRLSALPFFAASTPIQGNLKLRHVRIEQMAITARDLSMRNLSGDIQFGRDGLFEKALLEDVDRSIRLLATPSDQGIVLNVEGFGWKPLGGGVAFDALQAKGLLQRGKLLIRDLDSSLLGGVIKGNWLLDWRNGLTMAGDAKLERVDCRRLSAALLPALKLEGDLGGSLRFRSIGRDWQSLWGNVEAILEADITRGVLNGVDLGEAARRGPGGAIHGGATKFERLRANLTINPRQVGGRDIRMDAGMVTATGQFVAAAERPVDATLVVVMQTSVSKISTPVRVTGELSDLGAVVQK